MIEILDPKVLDKDAFDKGLIAEIQKFSLLDNDRIGWNYYMDYTYCALQFDKCMKNGMRVIDIGCGPGAIHGYLENKYKVDILGIDMQRWNEDYVDVVGNFNSKSFRNKHNLTENSVDIILSVSAIEHNKPSDHAKLIKNCLNVLKEDGRLIATASISNYKNIKVFKRSHQWNFDPNSIKDVYGEKVANADKYFEIWESWKYHKVMMEKFKDRF